MLALTLKKFTLFLAPPMVLIREGYPGHVSQKDGSKIGLLGEKKNRIVTVLDLIKCLE